MTLSYPKTLNQDFYRKHHKLFAALLNDFLLGKIMRKLLKIKLPLSNKIAFLHPNGFSVHVKGALFRAELAHYDYISINLHKSFGWLFSVFHWFDIYIANNFAPALNIGFDEYETPQIGVVVFGTTTKGYINYSDGAYKGYSWEEIRDLPTNGEGQSNIFILAEILGHRRQKMAFMARGIISYNTSFLTYNDVITEAGLRLHIVHPVNYGSNFEKDKLIITSHNKITSYVFPSNNIVSDDYGLDMFGTTEFCSITWEEYANNSPMDYVFDLNSAGLAYIKRGAHTAFGFMVEQDFINEDPTANVLPGDKTSYHLVLPFTGDSSFVFLYYSLDNQIVMNM